MNDERNPQTTGMRARVQVEIERRAVIRGRRLTAEEKIHNLAAALVEGADTPCPFCGAMDDEPCGVEAKSGTARCMLEDT